MAKKATGRIIVFVSGDVGNQETEIEIDQNEDKDMPEFLLELTWKVKPWFGVVKTLHKFSSGKIIENYNELRPGEQYVIMGSDDIKLRPFKEGRMIKRFDATHIYVLENGCTSKAPIRFVSRLSELNQWPNFLNKIAQNMNLIYGAMKGLFSMEGIRVKSPGALREGQCYVAVPLHQNFIKMDYLSVCIRFLPEKFLPVTHVKRPLSKKEEEYIRNYSPMKELYDDMNTFNACRFARSYMNKGSAFTYLPKGKFYEEELKNSLSISHVINAFQLLNKNEENNFPHKNDPKVTDHVSAKSTTLSVSKSRNGSSKTLKTDAVTEETDETDETDETFSDTPPPKMNSVRSNGLEVYYLKSRPSYLASTKTKSESGSSAPYFSSTIYVPPNSLDSTSNVGDSLAN